MKTCQLCNGYFTIINHRIHVYIHNICSGQWGCRLQSLLKTTPAFSSTQISDEELIADTSCCRAPRHILVPWPNHLKNWKSPHMCEYETFVAFEPFAGLTVLLAQKQDLVLSASELLVPVRSFTYCYPGGTPAVKHDLLLPCKHVKTVPKSFTAHEWQKKKL